MKKKKVKGLQYTSFRIATKAYLRHYYSVSMCITAFLGAF